MAHIQIKRTAALGVLLSVIILLSGCSSLWDVKDGDGALNSEVSEAVIDAKGRTALSADDIHDDIANPAEKDKAEEKAGLSYDNHKTLKDELASEFDTKDGDGVLNSEAFEIAIDDKELTILYTNDIHGYIANTVANDKGEEKPGLSYDNLKALKDDLEAEGKNVLLVDLGDHAQGAVYASMSEGDDMIELMNEVGYDIATLGNHEFDYGQFKTFKFIDNAAFPYVSCNYYNIADKSLVLPSYRVFDKDGIKVAFIGITTPQSLTSSAPKNFQDENGNYIYGIAAGRDGSELYSYVQAAIDDARDEADVVIALGHLGSAEGAAPYRSIDVIANTGGLDAFIDGHSHTRMEEELITDKDGNQVVLTQTGCYFSAIGDMEVKITDGKASISTSLIDTYSKKDETISAKINSIVEKVKTEFGKTIAEESCAFYINEPGTDHRLVRKQETNLGDLCADSVYYYYNDIMDLDCDMAIVNGGGIRQDMPNGLHTYLDCKTVEAFGNVTCLIRASGQTIKDALEMGARCVPNEGGGLLHVAGVRYSIDTSIDASLQLDERGSWVGAPTGAYRVHDIEVYNKETGAYEPLEDDKIYSIAGVNYILRNNGNGMTMFDGCESVVDYVGQDYVILAEYIKAFADNTVSTADSPLSTLKGYLIDYENPYGAGRITID